VDDRFLRLATLMRVAVETPLQGRADQPENTDSSSEPAGEIAGSGAHLVCEADGEDTEYHERDADELFVGEEYLADQGRHSGNLVTPTEDAVETEIQRCDHELANRGGDEKFVEVFE